jgi:thiol-disulfide isomerase/thioredoxin
MLLSGQSFADLATVHSDDTISKAVGGALDWAARGTYVPEFEDAAFGLKNVNQYTEPVETPFGYHIIKLDDRKESYDDLKDSLKFQLAMEKQLAAQQTQQEKEQKAITEYIDGLRSKADIKYADTGLSNIVTGEAVSSGGIRTFSEKADAEVCRIDGKPVIRLYSTTWCPHCKWIKDTFDRVAKEYEAAGKVKAYHWELDTGDDTLTDAVENEVPQLEQDIFAQSNERGSIPTFVFGCKYYRVGNGYEAEQNLVLEEAEFRAVMDKLLVE